MSPRLDNGRAALAVIAKPETAIEPPWSNEAEQAVLGALMLDGTAFGRVSDLLQERSFFDDRHSMIWTAIAGLASAGKHIDIVTVHVALKTAKQDENCGGMMYLNTLFNSVVSASGIRSYAEHVAEKCGERALLEVAHKALAIAKSGAPLADKQSRIAAELARIQPQAIDSLSVVFADELPDAFEPPDEIVEGVLTAEGGSVLYGDSNSGKTFFVIDMAATLARGESWMGKKTEPGMVVYLAAESPASVRSRLQAYQRHHGVKVPNFAIIQSPIDLFDGEADTEAVIQLVRKLEAQRGQRARLIVGDTLARLSAGANENAGQDMGLVVRRFDRIRTECRAHFLLVHHSGKAAAAGARGWSGIRAAVDTEIEVTDGLTGRCAEITKQRDLSTKGERIGFRLDTVPLGYTKWASPATSCVVMPTDAPVRPSTKRVSEVGGAILEVLTSKGSGMKKRELVAHFDGRYTSSAVYRELKHLVTDGQVYECIGIVTIAGGAKGAKGAKGA